MAEDKPDPQLHWACQNGRMDLVKAWIEKGKPVNNKSPQRGLTPLIVAAGFGDVEIFKFLIANGADPKITDNVGLTCLHVAAAKEGPMLAEVLTALKGPVLKELKDMGDEDGSTPLHHAAAEGQKENVEALLKEVVDITVQDLAGVTAEADASSRGFAEVAEMIKSFVAPAEASGEGAEGEGEGGEADGEAAE